MTPKGDRDAHDDTSDAVWREAERLAGTVLTMVSAAARGLRAAGTAGAGHGKDFATGSGACCVCPVCRLVSAMGEPGSDVADRLTRKAGDLAVSVTAMLRTLSPHRRDDQQPSPRRQDPEATATAEPADPWRAATTAPPPAKDTAR